MTVVLVHGAWHGAWAWDRVVDVLAGRDVPAVAVELPFTGFADDVAATRAAIERAGPDAVVCGHSYGGFVISAAARDLDVARLVYLCAFMVDEDEDVFRRWFAHPVPLHSATVVADGRSSIAPEKAAECFYGDAPADAVAAIVSRLRSFPAADMPDRADPAWRSVPSTYVVCARDQAIHADVQRQMARHATEVVEWECDHSPFVSRPDIVADLLARCVRGPRGVTRRSA